MDNKFLWTTGHFIHDFQSRGEYLFNTFLLACEGVGVGGQGLFQPVHAMPHGLNL